MDIYYIFVGYRDSMLQHFMRQIVKFGFPTECIATDQTDIARSKHTFFISRKNSRGTFKYSPNKFIS